MKRGVVSWRVLVGGMGVVLGLPMIGLGQHGPGAADAFTVPSPAADRAEAERSLRRMTLPSGWRAAVWATEPDVIHPVGFDVTDDGRVFVAESLRAWRGVPDIRNLMSWLDEDVAARTVEDRLAMMQRHWGEAGVEPYRRNSERVRWLKDTDGDGRADVSRVFADGFNSPLDGVASSVLVRGNEAWFANIPNVWHLEDRDGDGVAEARRSLSYGHGVRISMLGHDLHGLVWGPDGRIYVSVGDRGSSVLHEGRRIGNPESGAVFRFEPDGSGLEMFAEGLRNPQELVFDDAGNLFTGDNSANTGDESRWVQVVEGGDSGWRIGWQWAGMRAGVEGGPWREGPDGPGGQGPWNTESMWRPFTNGQPAYLVPPVANLAAGPCGNALYPGIGLGEAWGGCFLLTDFRGGADSSVIWRFRLEPQGAGFRMTAPEMVIRGVNATDVAWGPDGALWVLDWTDGWEPYGRGRIHRLWDPAQAESSEVRRVQRLLKEGWAGRPLPELAGLLADPDRRLRQGAQFELARRGAAAVPVLQAGLDSSHPAKVRWHSAWALGQVAREMKRRGEGDPGTVLGPVRDRLTDPDPVLRAIAARTLGDGRWRPAEDALVQRMADESAPVQVAAALALARMSSAAAVPAAVEMLRRNADRDPVVRHAGVMVLAAGADGPGLLRLAGDPSVAVRLAVVVALRRQERPELALFLRDADLRVVEEAARAIHDLPVTGALADLAALVDRPMGSWALARRAINAAYRLGNASAAEALARLAARPEAPGPQRVEALVALADWTAPAGRDRVTGLWRPSAFARDRAAGATALGRVLGGVLQEPSEEIRLAALDAAAALAPEGFGPALSGMVTDRRQPARVRREALRAVASAAPGLVGETLNVALKDPDESVRGLALSLSTRVEDAGTLPRLKRVLAEGAIRDRQAALLALGRVRDPGAAGVLGEWVDRLARGEVPPALRLEVWEAAGHRTNAAWTAKLAAWTNALATDPLGVWAVALEGGEAEAGGRILRQRPDVECIRCHKLDGQGGVVGPDLSGVGGRLDRRQLLEAVVWPDRAIAAGYETLLVTLKDGETVTGVAIAESAGELELLTGAGERVKVRTADIASRERGQSAMPQGLAEMLGPRALRDVVEFLASRKF